MASLPEQAKVEALKLSEDIFFEPGCFYPCDPFHEVKLRSIINDRATGIGHPLSLTELMCLVQDLADGKIHGAEKCGGDYSARLAIRIAQRTCN